MVTTAKYSTNYLKSLHNFKYSPTYIKYIIITLNNKVHLIITNYALKRKNDLLQ